MVNGYNNRIDTRRPLTPTFVRAPATAIFSVIIAVRNMRIVVTPSCVYFLFRYPVTYLRKLRIPYLSIYSSICQIPHKWKQTILCLLFRSTFACTPSLSQPTPGRAEPQPHASTRLLPRQLGAYSFYWKLIPATYLEFSLSLFQKDPTGLAPNTSEARH